VKKKAPHPNARPGNRNAAKDTGPRSMWSGRLPDVTIAKLKTLVDAKRYDSQADAIWDAVRRLK
jgi:hypothetical protein